MDQLSVVVLQSITNRIVPKRNSESNALAVLFNQKRVLCVSYGRDQFAVIRDQFVDRHHANKYHFSLLHVHSVYISTEL
jgi:hypothetical protein